MRRSSFRATRHGFTLVELLVVIGIIALLISILMPALGKVRNQALSVKCASNMRQMYQVALMFAQDNHGNLPSPGVPAEAPTDPNVQKYRWWASPDWGKADTSVGALANYMKGDGTRAELIRCPADNGEKTQGGGASASGDDRNMSYSFNAQTTDAGDSHRGGGVIKPGIRLASVSRGAERIYIFEEIAPNDAWCLLYDIDNPPGAINQTIGTYWRGDDVPSGRHAGQKFLNGMRDLTIGSPEWFKWAKIGKGNFVFFDGHVETLSPYDLFKKPDLFGPLSNPTPPPLTPG